MTWIVGGSPRFGRGSSGMPTARWFQPPRSNPSERPEEVGAKAGHTKDARAGVGADHRPDLRDQLGVAPIDLAALLGEPLGLGQRLHVLDRETVAPVLAAQLQVRDQPVER